MVFSAKAAIRGFLKEKRAPLSPSSRHCTGNSLRPQPDGAVLRPCSRLKECDLAELTFLMLPGRS